jgi:hypothetical protein
MGLFYLSEEKKPNVVFYAQKKRISFIREDLYADLITPCFVMQKMTLKIGIGYTFG